MFGGSRGAICGRRRTLTTSIAPGCALGWSRSESLGAERDLTEREEAEERTGARGLGVEREKERRRKGQWEG